MILRRLIEHFRRQEWTAIAIDFVIVVMGVFIGIQVSNWNQYAGERRAEREYLTQLRGDLQNIQKEVAAQIAFEQFHADLANDVYLLIQSEASPARTRKINIGLSELTVRRTLRTQSPTFLDLQGAGRLEIISDAALRAAIISYFYGSSRLEAALDKNNASFVDHGFNDFIRQANIPFRNWDESLMKEALPQSTRVNSVYAETHASDALSNAGGESLSAGADAPIWRDVIPQLSWRGNIAVSNESLAQRLGASTDDLEAKIAKRLEGRK